MVRFIKMFPRFSHVSSVNIKSVNYWVMIRNSLCILPLVAAFVFIMANLGKGIDITDEGYYIGNAIHAGENYATVTQFGHYTGMLWQLVNGDLVVFRGGGVCILMLLSSFFIAAIEQYWRVVLHQPVTRSQKVLNLTVVNCSAFVFYNTWLITPSYNWLALLSCLLVGGALIRLSTLISKDSDGVGMAPGYRLCALIGVGFMLAFMAKPTTALSVGIITLLWLNFSALRSYWLRLHLQIGGFTLLFFILHIVIFETGVGAFIEQLARGLELAQAMSPNINFFHVLGRTVYDLSGIPAKMQADVWLALLLLVVIALVNGFAFVWRQHSAPWLKAVNLLLLIAIALTAWLQLWDQGYWQGGINSGRKNGYAGLAFAVVIILGTLLTRLPHFIQIGHRGAEVKPLALLLMLMLLPLAYAFGSGNRVLGQSTGAYVFFALAAYLSAMWFDMHSDKKWLTYLLAILILSSSFFILKGASQQPYRVIGSLNQQTEPVSFIGSNTRLTVDPVTAMHIRGLQQLAASHSWLAGNGIIDMTGGTPLAAFILGGKPLGRVWLLGGNKGSVEMTFRVLQGIDDEKLRQAWVLTAPNGRRKIPQTVFGRLSIDFNDSFIKVGEVTSGHRNELQILWRPKTSLPEVKY
ncbi:MAG: hypothetical protein RPS47_04135 [Colwellia sp.]